MTPDTDRMATRWLRPDESRVAAVVREVSSQCLKAYREQPSRVVEDFAREAADAYGAYRERQLFELVQNGADAMTDARIRGRIEIVLTESTLYCANEGAAIDEAGAEALMHSHMSRKRSDQIGHFGLGFKSVLAVSTSPRFFSRSGSFEFDAAWSEQQIGNVLTTSSRTPVLRMARPVDPMEAAAADSELASLMEWATTVVVLPLSPESPAQLEGAIGDFPAPFLLFARSVQEIWLSSRSSGRARFLRAAAEPDGSTTLVDGESRSCWRVFERTVTVSDEALSELPPSAIKDDSRRKVPLAWAVPLDGVRSTGRFWSFFPTNDESTLSGILNGAWKTNNDRHALLAGPLNRELMGAFADLVSEAIPRLFDQADPGRHLDLLPARDPKSTADEELFKILFPVLASRAIVPDIDGRLRVASDLWLFPRDVAHDALLTWSGASLTRNRWIHPSVDTRERRPRALRLGATEGDFFVWLLEPTLKPSVHNSIVAITVIGMLLEDPRWQFYRSRARVLLCNTYELVAIDPERVFLTAEGATRAGSHIVHAEILENSHVRQILESLGLRHYDDERRLETLAIEHRWPEFWAAAHVMGVESNQLIRVMAERGTLRVRTLADSYELFFRVLLRGDVVPGTDGEDGRGCIDDEFHAPHLDLLASQGLVSQPRSGGLRSRESTVEEFKTDLKSRFLESIQQRIGRDTRPQDSYLRITPAAAAGPLDPLLDLSPAAAARYTSHLLEIAGGDDPWQITHSTRSEHYGSVSDLPVYFAIRQRGILETSQGVVPASRACGAELERWSAFLPVARFRAVEFSELRLPTDLDDLSPSDWQGVFARAESADVAAAGEIYVEAARRDVSRPPIIRCLVGGGAALRHPSTVTAVFDSTTAESAQLRGRPVLRLGSEHAAAVMIQRWGLASAETEEKPAVHFVPSAARMSGWERFGVQSGIDDLDVIQCSDLWVELVTEAGLIRKELQTVHDEGVFYFKDSLSDDEVIAELQASLPSSSHSVRLDLDSFLRDIRSCADDETRLSRLLGATRLRRRLPGDLLDDLRTDDVPFDARSLAAIALSIHGSSVLRYYAGDLVELRLDSPPRWNGSLRAIEFVASLGFGPEYAGTPTAAITPWIEVEGPIAIPPLHPFQRVVETNIRGMLRQSEPARGFVSLPTGAGKTRVVAEALTRAFGDGDLSGYVLWIADREELCEQAVETWSEVWRAFGPSRPLRISRLWGATNRRVAAVADRPHLVVATYQTLTHRLSSDFQWLASPACIVVDEAHGSTAPSFTAILEWMGLDSRVTPRPLIGISATPFKGEDAEATTGLAARYGHHRFDHGAFDDKDPYPFLQQAGVLARVDHRELEGVDIQLTPVERQHLETFHVLHPSAEERLGSAKGRNDRIVSEIEKLPPDWPVLAFGLSVGHAELLAAMLSLRGTRAVAISSRTAADARRAASRDFRSGRLRVLTNYNVLTTGFDAPGVRAIFVTRPVFSPGLYQQMIGRGLRGPANGGKERCLIVNVADNLSQYGETLAFRHFEHLWSGK